MLICRARAIRFPGCFEEWQTRDIRGGSQGATPSKRLKHYLVEFAFRFNRRKTKAICLDFTQPIQYATKNPPTTSL